MSSRLKLAGICVAAAFALAACGGGGSALDSARAERDRLAAMLAQVTQARDDALAQVTTLRGQLNTANQNLMDKQSELDTANQNLMDKQSELDTANQNLMDKQAEVDRLVGDQDVAAIRAKDPADRTQAEQQLLDAVDARDTAQRDVTRLTGERDDANDDVTRLQGELDTANGRVRELEGQLRTADNVRGLFETAATTYTAGAAAERNARQAVLDAQKYAGMLTAMRVNGESAKAIENAQSVLDAQEAANNAVMDAEQILEDAEAAKMTAEGLDDSATKTALVAALNAAIEDAKSKVTAAKAARDVKPATANTETDPTSLTIAVQMVTGTDTENPNDPADAGDAVAETVLTALSAITPGTTAPTSAQNGVVDNDGMAISAMTWAMIVGEDNVVKKRLGTIDATGALTPGNGEVSVASLEGMTAADVAPDGTDLSATGNTDGDATTGGTYKGILGAVVCLGGSDGCEVTNGILGAGWYFSPAAPTELYIAGTGAAAGTYVVATMYARYGYWLTFDGAGAATGVNTYSALGNTATNTANLKTTVEPGSTDTSATYNGKAVGISVHEVTDTHDNRLSIASGKFTADVTLNAKWGATARLGGTVSNFQGNAVDRRWSVKLTETDITNDASVVTATAGTTEGDAGQTAGTWTAAGYGPPQTPASGGNPAVDHRPTGFHGTFSASFTDGAAAGAYAVRK